MKELWTKEEPSFAGKYYRFSDMPFSPKPLQKPHIPVLIGGNSRLPFVGQYGWAMGSTRLPSRQRRCVKASTTYGVCTASWAEGGGDQSRSASRWGLRRRVGMPWAPSHEPSWTRSWRLPAWACRCSSSRAIQAISRRPSRHWTCWRGRCCPCSRRASASNSDTVCRASCLPDAVTSGGSMQKKCPCPT